MRAHTPTHPRGRPGARLTLARRRPSGLIQIAIAYLFVELPFLASSMLSTIVYLWAREYAEQVISIFGLFNVQAFYFPWVRGRVARTPGLGSRALVAAWPREAAKAAAEVAGRRHAVRSTHHHAAPGRRCSSRSVS